MAGLKVAGRWSDTMTANEFHNQILELLRREPFAPFEIELLDGTVLHVTHPEMVCTSGGGGAFAGPDGEIVLLSWRETKRLGPKAPSLAG
jgi:hypothetical protein